MNERLLARLERRSSELSEPKSRLAERLIDEGLRMEELPGIVFRNGPSGRRVLRLLPGRDRRPHRSQRRAARRSGAGARPARIRVRILLDEMWSPAIAAGLRKRGHDAIGATEPEHHLRYGAIADDALFARAQEDGRTGVTDNVPDFEPLVAELERRGTEHHGVVFCSPRQFDRSDPRTTGRMVEALAAFLASDESGAIPFNRRHWLRRAG